MSDTLSIVIEAISKLDAQEVSTLRAHLQAVDSDNFFETLTPMQIKEFEVTESDTLCCPNCLSLNIISWGKYKDRKHFKCHNCNRIFNSLTGTVWHYLHSHEKFKNFIYCAAQQESIRASANAVGVCITTAFYWWHKLLNTFKTIEQNRLKGEIQTDETFILESNKGQLDIVTKQKRKPRKRGGSASKNGTSKEQVCIMVAVDNQGTTFLEVAGKGTLTKKRFMTL